MESNLNLNHHLNNFNFILYLYLDRKLYSTFLKYNFIRYFKSIIHFIAFIYYILTYLFNFPFFNYLNVFFYSKMVLNMSFAIGTISFHCFNLLFYIYYLYYLHIVLLFSNFLHFTSNLHLIYSSSLGPKYFHFQKLDYVIKSLD